MRKGILGAMGWLLVALLLLPVGAMAQGAKEKVRITAEVFDSYDNTFVRDEYGIPKNRRTHEKGGELWVEYDGKTIPAASFNQEVEEGKELIFKVKLAKDEKGDWGEMANFGTSSDWWEVCEWRVNGEVQPTTGNDLSYTAKAGTKSVHVGVRFQRKQFQVKVVYYRLRGGGLLYSANGGSWNPLSNESPKTLNRNSSLQFKAQAFDVADFSLNGVTYGRFLALSDMGSYNMSQGDLWIEVSYSDAATSRRYIQTLCQGDGEKERFQINTLPLVGTSTDKSHYPIAGVATGKEAKVRPLGIQPSDLCLAPDRFVILAKPKRGSRLAYITIDNAVVHDTIFTVPDNEPRTVVGYFVKEGKQILMLSEVGKGAHLKVVRGNTELRAGAEVLPGDRLVVDVTDRSTVKSLRINGRRFAPGDEWLVQGSGDVLVELITTTKNKFNEKLAGAPLLQCEVIGGGSVEAKARMKNGTWGEFTSGQLLYADSVWDGIPPYCENITLTPKPQNGYRCVKFEVNGEERPGGGIHQVNGKDVYVRAIFVKKSERPALVVHTKGAIGYVDVIDAATGQPLEEGTILKQGQRLLIQARGSTSEKSRVTAISVNDSTFTANGAANWAKEVTVSEDDAKNDAFRVGATFEKATIQPPTPGTQPVLHIVKGKGVSEDFIVDVCGPAGALGEAYPIRDGEREYRNETSGYIALGIPNGNNFGLGRTAENYDWISTTPPAEYEITVVNKDRIIPVIEKPRLGYTYWGPGIDWKKDVYVYIRKKGEETIPITMVQVEEGKTYQGKDLGVSIFYDQVVNPLKYKPDGLWEGSVPKGATISYNTKEGAIGLSNEYKLVAITINDSLVARGKGGAIERNTQGSWKVPDGTKEVKVVTYWRKQMDRTVVYAWTGKGAVTAALDSGGTALENGARVDNKVQKLAVTAEPGPGYKVAWVKVNGAIVQYTKADEKVTIPQDVDVYVEALFIEKQHGILQLHVRPNGAGDVEVIRGVDTLATGAEVKGGDVLAITARPAAGKRLVVLRVNGELFPNGNCYIVPSGKDVSVEATFVREDGYALFVEQEGEGEVVVERKSAAQGVWSEIYSGDAINSTDEIRVKATAATDYKLEALFVNQRNQHGAESGKYTEGMAVGQGNIYVRAIFKKASDTERRLYIVTTPGGYVKVATPDGKELRDGDTIDASVKDLTVSSYAFPGNRAVLLQVNWVNHKSGDSYSVPQKGNVFVEARFVPTHRIALAIEVQNSALGGDVVVTDAETGARLYDGAQLEEGQTIRVEVTGIGQAAELPVPEVSGPAHRQSSGTNTWVVEGNDGVVYVRVAFAKEYYTVRFLAGEYGSGTMDAQRVPVGIKTKLHLNQFIAKGYRFDGWKAANDSTYTDGETVLDLAGKDGTAELTAQWKAIYEVTFMLNGGEMNLPENPMVVDAGTSLNLKDDYIPYRLGYTFKGWYHEKNFATEVVSPYQVNRDVRLYARWETTGSNTVDVTFDLDGGKYLGSTENVVISVEKGKSVEELKPAPTKEGYTFEGWKLDGNKYGFNNTPVNKDITLFAMWKKIEEYTVTFDANGGRPSVESQRVKKDGFASMPVVMRDGWELRGWYDGVNRYEFTEKVKRDLALKAEWSPKVIFSEGVKVTDENARELSSGDTVRCGSSIDVRVHAPQGKRIKSVTIGGSVKPVNAKSFSRDNWDVSRPTTIYAEWEEWKEYTVTFDSKGGTAVASQRVEEGKKAIKPADPTKADSVFVWWYQNDKNTQYDFDAPVTEDITLKALWEKSGKEEHMVTFDADGGTLSNGQSILKEKVDNNMRAPKPADPKKANYEFKGWLLEGNPYDFSTAVTKDITLVAQWKPELVCTVTFDANGGTLDNGESTKTVTVAKDGRVKEPKAPQKAGYDFNGWFLGTGKYTFTEEVKEDITLLAQWKKSATADEFKVTFNADGGKLSDGKETREVPVAKDGKVTKPVDPEKPGYDFVGWYDGTGLYDFNKKVTGNITLKAEWKEKQGVLHYTVTFDANGGTLSSGGASQQVSIAKNEKVKEPGIPVKQGFEFKGWFYNGQPYNFALPVTEDITLVAQWAVKSGKVEFKVTFDADEGKFSDGMEKREVPVAKGEKVTKPADPEKPGYDLVGWNLGKAPYDFNTPVTGDITLVAVWNESKKGTEYTVTFDSDGGTMVTPQVVKKGEKVHEPADPKKANYDFDGWYLKKAPYDFNTPVTEDITLVAQWKEKSGKQEFTVTFDFDNGTPVATQIVEKGGTATEPPAKPTKANYDFVEWQLNGKNYEFNTPVTENITLVAKWKKSGKEEFTVSFDSDGGTPVASQKVEKDKYAKEPDPAPAKAGYTFVEWQLNGTKYEFSTTQVARDITLKAKWDKKPGGKQEYTVTFDSKGGTAVPSQTVEEGKNATKPAEPTKTGYTFVEWQLRGVRYDFTETVTGNITLVAEWKRAVGVAITVVDGPNNGVEGATVTIVDEDGNPQEPATTDHDGNAIVPKVPVPTKGTVTVKAKIDGKDTVVTVPVEVDQNGDATPNEIDLKDGRFKGVSLTVADAKTGNGIEDAIVKVGTQEAKTKDEGKVTLNLMVGKKGYPVLAKAAGYADGEVVVSVNDKGIADPDTIWLTVVKDVKITVKNGKDPVKDAIVTIVDGNGDPHVATTDAGGNTTVPDVPAPTDGTVTVKKIEGNDTTVVTVPVKVDKEGKADPSEIDFKSAKPVGLTVVDSVENVGIDGATVTVGAQTAKTKVDGKVTLNLVVGKDGYTVLAKATGYADGKVKVSVDADGKATPNEIKLKPVKDVTIKVTNGTDPVKGADVTIVDGNGNPYKAKTDDDGNAKVEDVPVPIEKNGTVTVEKGEKKVTVPVTVDKDGIADPAAIDLDDKNIKEVKVTVADAKTRLRIKDATVTVGAQRDSTDGDGEVRLNLWGIDGIQYRVVAQAEGYVDSTVMRKVEKDGNDKPFLDTIWLTPLAAPYLNVFVVDQDLKPIDSVVVKIFSGTDSITQDTTKTEGWVKMELTAKRTYTIAVKKDGYNKPEPVEVFLETRGLDFTFVLQKEVQNNGNTTPVESELLAGVELYPNPASVATVLHGVENAKRIAVYTLTGVQVMSQAVHGEKELSLQVESLTEGVYVVVVESANGERKALKLVVRR